MISDHLHYHQTNTYFTKKKPFQMDPRFFRQGLDPTGFFSKNSFSSPFRFFGPKSTEDERVAMMERFRAEGLDARKLNDAQMLPFVWQWLGDAEINCKSLRHQIDKMRRQHDEELQEVGDYVEQVWKLSTEKLIFLEAENANLKEHQNCHHRRSLSGDDDDAIHDDDDDDDENSETESRNNRNYFRSKNRQNHILNNSSSHYNSSRQFSGPQTSSRVYRRPMATSASTSSLATSVSGLCDNLNVRPSFRTSQSSSQLNDLISRASLKLNAGESDAKIDSNFNSKDDFCEKCEILDTELLESRTKVLELEGTVEELSEKCFVLEKLNRNIELENENFAYKLAEAENRSNDLERKILNLEKEQTRISAASKTNEHTGKVLVQELNQKIKSLEEEMDLRAQLFEELEMKYQKQKERHQETLWKLRNFIHDKDSQNSVELFAVAASNDSDSGHKSSESGFSQSQFHTSHPSNSHRHRSIDKLV